MREWVALTCLLLGCAPSAVVPPANLPTPIKGQQRYEKLKRTPKPCTDKVYEAITTSAQAHDLAVQVAIKDVYELDIELQPQHRITDLKNRTDASLADYATQCMLFGEVYAENSVMTSRLKDYLVSIQLNPDRLSEEAMRGLGFTEWDISHLRGHLTSYLADQFQEDPRYKGITYIRITYSSRPVAELTMNIGTVQKDYQLSDYQQVVISEIRDAASAGAKCQDTTSGRERADPDPLIVKLIFDRPIGALARELAGQCQTTSAVAPQ